MRINNLLPFVLAYLFFISFDLYGQKSIAREWNEAILQTIREDFARPPVQARNLFHLSAAMYDAWAAYDTAAQPYLLGRTVGQFNCPCTRNFPRPKDSAAIAAARHEAISFAAYRILSIRFALSPKASGAFFRFRALMNKYNYKFNNLSIDYEKGSPAALGNYIAHCYIQMGLQDGSNEKGNYGIQFYKEVNTPLVILHANTSKIANPNRWQPLKLPEARDQNGHPIPAVQAFQSPEWGQVQPFALTPADKKVFTRDGKEYWVYHDPGPFPTLDSLGGGLSSEYRWNFELVLSWSAHLDPKDTVKWDISPASIGNVKSLPQTLEELHTFYDFKKGGDGGKGRPLNPKTGKPYTPQIVSRADYARVLTQFWADGPTSETPPGHWFSIFNYVCDQPELIRKFNGKGREMDPLEWDIKGYFTLGAALHDAAISAWSIKGWYDGVRPITALQYMASKGQCTSKKLPRYHPQGVDLIPGLIEQIKPGDPLAGTKNKNAGKIKFYGWRGPFSVKDTAREVAGVGWMLAENWLPYQLKTFITPPFAGYVSGHSTYSRAGAEALTLFTGDEYFPRGLGEFFIDAHSNFLRVEEGPSGPVTLQWATYRDASDQTSLSRIWGGIHPPFDDIPGRIIGAKVGTKAYELAKVYFYRDRDRDGYFSYEDCDDLKSSMHPGATEVCDGMDNDCDGIIDEDCP